MQNMSDFVEVMQELMINKNLKAIDIAKGANINKSLISEYLNGISLPNAKNLIKIAEFLDVNIDYLIGRTVVKQPFVNMHLSTFFERVNFLKDELKVGVRKFQREANVSNAAYYDWRAGSMPYIPQIIALADYFCVSADYLLGLTDKR